MAHPDERTTGDGSLGAAALPLRAASDVLARVASEGSEAGAAARGCGGREDGLPLRSLKLNLLDERLCLGRVFQRQTPVLKYTAIRGPTVLAPVAAA